MPVAGYKVEPRTTTEVIFWHPDREMLKNQLGLFILETLMEYEAQRTKPDDNGRTLEQLVEARIDRFMRILDRKAGF